MVKLAFHPDFRKEFKKITEQDTKDRLVKQFQKIRENPHVGKPMRYTRQKTREVYVGSYRLSYYYNEQEDKVVILDFYHKDQQ